MLRDLGHEPTGASDREARRAAVAGLLDALATRPDERAEDVLLDLKLVDDEGLALALAFRSGRPYQGLRDFIPDERLFLYLPLSIAVKERLLPLVLADDSLVVASAFVDADVSYLRERFPNLAVVLVISPRKEILEALRRVGE
jgi:MshEN domain